MSRINHDIDRLSSIVIRATLRILALVLLLLLLIGGARRGYRFGYEIFSPEPMERYVEEDVVVTEGEPDAKLAEQLEADGLIRDKHAWTFTKAFYNEEVVPGTYHLNSRMTIREMLAAMSAPES